MEKLRLEDEYFKHEIGIKLYNKPSGGFDPFQFVLFSAWKSTSLKHETPIIEKPYTVAE